MKTKILLFSMALMLIIGFAVGAYWWKHRPQVIVLENGDRLTLVGVTYGKHHAPPRGKQQSRRRAPAVAGRVPKLSTRRTIRWWSGCGRSILKPLAELPALPLRQANTACVGGFGKPQLGAAGGSNEIVAAQFDAFPRRQAVSFCASRNMSRTRAR